MEEGEAFAKLPVQTSGCQCGVRARAGDGEFRLRAGTAKSLFRLCQFISSACSLPRPLLTQGAHQFWKSSPEPVGVRDEGASSRTPQ